MHFATNRKILTALGWVRYVIALAIFIFFTGFVGEHSVEQRLQRKQEITALRQQIRAHRARFAADKQALDLLKNDIDEVRRVAREKYYMRRPNEDVFIIEDE